MSVLNFKLWLNTWSPGTCGFEPGWRANTALLRPGSKERSLEADPRAMASKEGIWGATGNHFGGP